MPRAFVHVIPNLYLPRPRRRLCEQCSYVIRPVIHSVCHSVGLSVCRITVEVISLSLKLDVMIRPTNRKNGLTFVGDPVPDTDSGSLFDFPRHCGIEDLGCLLAFLIQSPASFHDKGRKVRISSSRRSDMDHTV